MVKFFRGKNTKNSKFLLTRQERFFVFRRNMFAMSIVVYFTTMKLSFRFDFGETFFFFGGSLKIYKALQENHKKNFVYDTAVNTYLDLFDNHLRYLRANIETNLKHFVS